MRYFTGGFLTDLRSHTDLFDNWQPSLFFRPFAFLKGRTFRQHGLNKTSYAFKRSNKSCAVGRYCVVTTTFDFSLNDLCEDLVRGAA